MTPLERISSMKMPFAELKGIKFTEADKDRVVAKMVVRPDLCTLHHTIHGGAIMAFADSVGAAATAGASRTAYPGVADAAGNRGRQARCHRHTDANGALIWGSIPSQKINESLIQFC